MPLYFTKKNVEDKVTNFINSKKRVGLVPTMGSLHDGHLSLIKKANINNDEVWVSIFVNPTQFNNPEDLNKYPRNLKNDIKLIKKISKNIHIYSPSEKEIYAGTPKINVYNFKSLDKQLEGKFRKNHFNGVATIVSKLLSLLKPNNFYLGEKDFQQTLIIKKLIVIEKINVKIIVCPTVREKNGLALSSRNKLLNKSLRDKSSIIFKNLCYLKENFKSSNLFNLKSEIIEKINSHKNFKVEYLDVADTKNLKICKKYTTKNSYRAFICVKVNEVRLIDNILLN